MIIVLKPHPTPEVDPTRPRADRGAGLHAAPEPGGRADDHRRDRRRGQAPGRAAPGDRRGRAGRADPQAVQARQPRVPRRRLGLRHQGGAGRRRPPDDDRRAVRDRGGGGPQRDRRQGPRGRGQRPPRRGVQAEDQPVQLPGARRGRPQDPQGGRRAARDAGRHRGHGPAPGRAGRAATPTSSRSAPGTCRTSTCSRRSARPGRPSS